MATLLVKKQGQLLAQLELVLGQEYVIGRAPDSDVVLGNERGISRHHIKLINDDGVWVAELLSKYSEITFEGESCSALELSKGVVFTTSVYSFEYIVDEPKAELAPVEPDTKTEPINNLANAQTDVVPVEVSDPEEVSFNDTISKANDKTLLENSSISAFLTITVGENSPSESFKLEGTLWSAGRDPNCEVYINHPNVSRRHLEIVKSGDDYYVTDLKSSNGTKVNGNLIEPDTPERLDSGSLIKIKNIQIKFEIRNTQYDKMLQVIPQGMSANPYEGAPGNSPNVMRMPAENSDPKTRAKNFLRANKIRVLIGALIVFGLYFGMGDNFDKKQADSASTKKELSKEQITQIKVLLESSKNHYHNERYMSCLSELKKLHIIVPVYEDSTELQNLCGQAIEITKMNEEKERIDQLKKQNEQRAEQIISECEDKIDSFKTEAELNQCLADVVNYDPANPKPDELRAQIRTRLNKITAQKESERAKNERVRQGTRAFKKCERLFNSESYNDAISVCQKYIQGGYPGQGSKPGQAKKYLTSSKKLLGDKVNALLGECQAQFQQKKYKLAIKKCSDVTKRMPSNTEAKGLKGEAKSKLKREMKSLYEDAILEESMGNVEAAKQKFTQILEEDIPGGKYHSRAKSKMKIYGE